MKDTAEDRMTRAIYIAIAGFGIGIALLILAAVAAFAHDHGRTDQNWEEMSDEERDWIKNLKMPDMPYLSCCGLADQYWCDKVYTRWENDDAGKRVNKTFCQITDDRDDKKFNRPHVPIGTEIEIPDHKFMNRGGNPTGHSIIFMNASKLVYCFVVGTLT